MSAPRPKFVVDGQGQKLSYRELLDLLHRQLQNQDPHNVERVFDIVSIVEEINRVGVPFQSRRLTIRKLTLAGQKLSVLNWPDVEYSLALRIKQIITRLEHTRRRPSLPPHLRRKLKPADQLKTPTTRRSK